LHRLSAIRILEDRAVSGSVQAARAIEISKMALIAAVVFAADHRDPGRRLFCRMVQPQQPYTQAELKPQQLRELLRGSGRGHFRFSGRKISSLRRSRRITSPASSTGETQSLLS